MTRTRPKPAAETRLYVSVPEDLARKIKAWCQWTGTTPSEVARRHFEEVVGGFEIRTDKAGFRAG